MGIRSAFKARHPVWVFLVSVSFTPIIGFMYINRGRLALSYLALMILLIVGLVVSEEYGINTEDRIFDFFFQILHLIVAIYCVYLVRKNGLGHKIKWYAKFASVLSFFGFCLIGFILGIILPIRTFYLEPIFVPAPSMEPTLQSEDYILLDRRIYGYSQYSFPKHPRLWEGKIFAQKPQRGDVVVFALPTDTKVHFVKRIIGLPGDEIQMKEGNLYINNAPAKNEIIGEYTVKNSYQREVKLTKINETLPEGKSYNILDESKYGTLDETGVYKVPEGHYFVLGDNRDYSQDSRVTNVVGPVPEENIIGRAAYVYYSGVEQKLVFRKIE